MKAFLQFLVVIGLISSTSYGQSHKIRFKHYSIDHGLSQNTVFSLLEDKEGAIWIGTEDGLNKFDGYTFTNFRHQNLDSSSISHNQINDLHEDKHGKIWIATSDGLNTYDKKTETFKRLHIPNNPNTFITSIFEDSKGEIWITLLNGLHHFQPKQDTFEHFPYRSNNRADKIMEDSQGIFWISADKSLQRFDPVKKQYIKLPALLEDNEALRNSYPRTIKEDHRKRIWVGNRNRRIIHL